MGTGREQKTTTTTSTAIQTERERESESKPEVEGQVRRGRERKTVPEGFLELENKSGFPSLIPISTPPPKPVGFNTTLLFTYLLLTATVTYQYFSPFTSLLPWLNCYYICKQFFFFFFTIFYISCYTSLIIIYYILNFFI